MSCAEVHRVKRSYDRNLGWCRFWLGISLAVFTLMFSFAVDQVFEPLTERPPGAADERSDTGPNKQEEPFSFTAFVVMFLLFLVASICAGLSVSFRALYQRDDRALTVIKRPHQEATP